MAVTVLTSKIFIMADTVKNIFSKETLFPLSLVLSIITAVFFYASDKAIINSRLKVLEKENTVLRSELSNIEQSMITKEIFQLKMENFETKIDQVLDLVEKKK